MDFYNNTADGSDRFLGFSPSLFTSSATTANPRPATPALAASIEAFKANRLVCSEILSIESAIWLISVTLSVNRTISLIIVAVISLVSPALRVNEFIAAFDSLLISTSVDLNQVIHKGF